jgi:hypothetical protein
MTLLIEDKMSSRFKDFGAGTSSEDKEPIVFKLYDEEFTCVPVMQGKALMSLVSRSQSEDPVEAMGVIDTFFSQTLTDESLERFNALLEDKNRVVAMETLGEIIAWLVEEYSGRPNQQPEDS